MPATVTHAYFANDVYDILNNDIKNRLDLDRVKMYGQSMDSLRFYNLFNFKRRKYEQLGHIFHTEKTKCYFINLINYIKNNNLGNDSDTMSYLVGLICHYVLDSNVHPYVFYKTGKFDKKMKSTYKYNNIHLFMETFIDNDMIKRREKVNPYKFDICKFCFDTSLFSENLTKAIDYSFLKTYNVSNMGYVYYKSLKDMELALKLFRQDKYGIKKFFYKLIDTITPKSVFRFEAVSYHYPLIDKHNFLNTNHNEWHNPVKYTIVSTSSFIDLYLLSIKEAKNIIMKTIEYINGNNIILDDLFTNKSYITGLDCDINKELKYFEF